jgi:hypothetical protein
MSQIVGRRLRRTRPTVMNVGRRVRRTRPTVMNVGRRVRRTRPTGLDNPTLWFGLISIDERVF